MSQGTPPNKRFGFKTVYSRMLYTFTLIVGLSMAMLTLLLGMMFRQQYVDERVQEMRRESSEVNRIVAEKYQFKEKRDVAYEELDMIARKYNALIQVYDNNAEITVVDPQKRSDWEKSTLADAQPGVQLRQKEYFQSILDGKIIQTQGYFGNSFSEPVMTVGRPLVINNQIEGAIFIHEKLTEITQSVNAIYSNVMISSILALGAAVILIAFMARAFTKPLVEMNKAAHSYAKGNFSERVVVKTNDEIGELGESLNSMANDLESLENMRSSFVANVSHELKAPLSSMRGFVQALLDGTIPQKDSKEYLSIVLGETVRLSSMINELLDLSKIESGKFPMHKSIFDLNELVRRILITFEGRIDEKSLEVDINFMREYIVVDADQDRIAQVFSNLIDNAIKYTEPAGKLFVVVRATESTAHVSVRDTGLGIPPDDLPHIFERFYKVEKAHTPGIEGTGLGLSIAKKIMDQHECEFTCRSKLNKGSVFSFTLPLAMQQQKRK